jgi:hypothetical protein
MKIKENLEIGAERKAVWLPPEVHYALKKVAVDENQPIHNLVAILINNYLIYKNETNK